MDRNSIPTIVRVVLLSSSLAIACGDPGDADGSGVSLGDGGLDVTGTPMGSEDDGVDAGSSGGSASDAGSSGAPGDGDTSGGVDDGGTTGIVDDFDPGLCAEAPPMGAAVPPAPPAYSGGACPALVPGWNTGFASGGNLREFALLVPSEIDSTGTYPLAFAWHHLGGDAMALVDTIDGQALADQARAIIVVPQNSGQFQFEWPDTPLDIGQAAVDLTFFDDLYACVAAQYPINTSCVASIGVSAGGLWTSYLGTVRGQYLASDLSLSGGYPSEFTGPWWPWVSPRPYAAMVLWGGPSDMLGIDFNAASLALLGQLTANGHFVLRCEHDAGHGVPPVEGNADPLRTVMHFVRNHPYWLTGTSPLQMGLPDFYPSYCTAL